MSTNIKTFLILVLFIVLIGFGIYREISYRTLRQDYIELKYNNLHRVDSLTNSIDVKNSEIKILEKQIEKLCFKIDSLEKVKLVLKKDSLTMSYSANGSFSQLKENLWKE